MTETVWDIRALHSFQVEFTAQTEKGIAGFRNKR